MDTGGGQLIDLEHVHNVGPVDAHELRPHQQQRLVVLQRTRHLPHRAVGQVEVEMLSVDLHIGQPGKRHPHQRGTRLQGQAVLRTLLPQHQLVQYGEQQAAADGLEQIFQRPHTVALVGEARGGREEHDIGGIVKGAYLAGGVHAVDAGHHHIQQVQAEPLALGHVQHAGGAAERVIPQGEMPLRLPLVQQCRQGGQLLRLIIADRYIHRKHLRLNNRLRFYHREGRFEKSCSDISCRKNIHFKDAASCRRKKLVN